MTKTFKALAALLTYPTGDLQAAAGEITAVLDAEARLPDRVKPALHALVAELANSDLLELQERYVALFDRGRATSLNLFEHVHGESRERGPAMVDLMQVYTRSGFSLASNELPDYVPVLLEYLSHRPFPEAHEMLGDCAHILRKLGETLGSRGSKYAAVPSALLAMIGEAGLTMPARNPGVDAALAADDKSLDDDWMDAPVVFGSEGAPDCKPVRPASSVIQFMPRRN